MDKEATSQPIKKIGQVVKDKLKVAPPVTGLSAFLVQLSDVSRFAFRYFVEVVKPPYEFKELGRQCYLIGYKTFSLVGVTAFIMGIVLTVQSRPTLAKFGAISWMPGMISVSVIREIGPVITALIFAGKVGSGIGAELASMRVTEQIDAMEVSGINPFKYVVVTRILAATLMLPLLVIFSDGIALIGSFISMHFLDHSSLQLYFSRAFQKLDFIDIFPAFVKTFFFGFVIGLVSCYEGYNSSRGTEGVGIAANTAVVFGSLMIFILDAMAVQISNLFN